VNKEAKEMWIDALRSGKYTQGKSCLKGVDGNYCCLGVLVEVFENYYGLKFNRQINSCKSAMEFGSFGSVAAPPELVIAWINLLPKHQTLLMNLNDKHGCNFAGIADLLEHLD
jgi:hypothetical protein